MQKFDSVSLSSAEYNSAERCLDIVFTNGSRYIYFDVSEDIYTQLLSAPSKGRFFNEKIQRIYRFQKKI